MPDILAPLCFLIYLGYLPYGLFLGIRILIRTKEEEGEAKRAFIVTALNVLEPIYTPLFWLLIYLGSIPLDYDRTLGSAWPLALLLPVLSLLLPVFKWNYREPLLRQLNWQVFWIGLGRIVTFILSAFSFPTYLNNVMQEKDFALSFGTGSIIMGTAVLWLGIFLIHRFFRNNVFHFSAFK
jgi:hypothetical protein